MPQSSCVPHTAQHAHCIFHDAMCKNSNFLSAQAQADGIAEYGHV